MRTPRLSGWLVFTLALCAAIYLLAPQQLPITVYKLSLVTLGGVVGYWLSRAAVDLRVSDHAAWGPAAASLIIYRGLCVSAGMLSLSLGA
jgi:hypothetical protein